MFLRSAADFFGAVRASSPVVAGDVAPLQYALSARHTLRKFVNGAKYNIATCSGKIPVTKNQFREIGTLLARFHDAAFLFLKKKLSLSVSKRFIVWGKLKTSYPPASSEEISRENIYTDSIDSFSQKKERHSQGDMKVWECRTR